MGLQPSIALGQGPNILHTDLDAPPPPGPEITLHATHNQLRESSILETHWAHAMQCSPGRKPGLSHGGHGTGSAFGHAGRWFEHAKG